MVGTNAGLDQRFAARATIRIDSATCSASLRVALTQSSRCEGHDNIRLRSPGTRRQDRRAAGCYKSQPWNVLSPESAQTLGLRIPSHHPRPDSLNGRNVTDTFARAAQTI